MLHRHRAVGGREPRRRTRGGGALSLGVALLLACAVFVGRGGTAHAAGTIVVHRSQHIQAALDRAAPGTTVLVEEGTYAENLQISKDGITLRGEGGPGGVRLVPPTNPAPVCGETATDVIGICVARVLSIGPGGPVLGTVSKVHITDLTIRHFSDSGILMIQTSGTRVDDVRSIDNGGYGVFALQSTGVRITGNLAVGNHEAGLYVGDSPQAGALMADNTAHGNGFGVFFRDSRGGRIVDNTLDGNCVGMVLLNTGAGAGVGDVTATDNETNRNNRACPGGDGPPTSGIGIAILGGDHIALRDGTADGNRAAPGVPTFASGGIVLARGSSNITVSDYEAELNSTDLVVMGPLATNLFTEVDCETSSPAGLCHSDRD